MKNEFWLDDETAKLGFTQRSGEVITVEEAHVLALQQITHCGSQGQGAVEFSATWDTADICKP